VATSHLSVGAAGPVNGSVTTAVAVRDDAAAFSHVCWFLLW